MSVQNSLFMIKPYLVLREGRTSLLQLTVGGGTSLTLGRNRLVYIYIHFPKAVLGEHLGRRRDAAIHQEH